MMCSHSINPSTVFLTFDMGQLGKIRRHHWKERLNVCKEAKFESDSEGDIAPQSCEHLQSLYARGGGGTLGLRLGLGWGGGQVCFVTFEQITFTLGNFIHSKDL